MDDQVSLAISESASGSSGSIGQPESLFGASRESSKPDALSEVRDLAVRAFEGLGRAEMEIGNFLIEHFDDAKEAFRKVEPFNRIINQAVFAEGVPLALAAAGNTIAQEFVKAEGLLVIELASMGIGAATKTFLGTERTAQLLHEQALPWFSSLPPEGQIAVVGSTAAVLLVARLGWQAARTMIPKETAANIVGGVRALSSDALVRVGYFFGAFRPDREMDLI